MYKKSPLRSPLREVLKNQCRERMKSNRDNVVGRMRNIQMEDKDMLENEIRLVVKDELAAWRGGRKCLSFGYSSEDIDDALKDVEDIENELLVELFGIDFNYEDELLSIQSSVLCPLCQESKMEDRQASGMIRCRSKRCGISLLCIGGLDTFQKDLEMVVDRHSEYCAEVLQFDQGQNCLLAVCYACDFCHTLGGF